MLVSWEDKMDRGASDLSVLKTFFLVIFCNVLLNKVFLKRRMHFICWESYFYCTQPPNTHDYGGQKARTSSYTWRKHILTALASSQAPTWAAVAAVWRRRDSSHRQRATPGQSPLASQGICSGKWGDKENENQQQLRRCGPNFANLKLTSS